MKSVLLSLHRRPRPVCCSAHQGSGSTKREKRLGLLLGEGGLTDCAEVKRALNKILVSCNNGGFLPIAFYASDGFTRGELG